MVTLTQGGLVLLGRCFSWRSVPVHLTLPTPTEDPSPPLVLAVTKQMAAPASKIGSPARCALRSIGLSVAPGVFESR
jgi:hypothetical protein